MRLSRIAAGASVRCHGCWLWNQFPETYCGNVCHHLAVVALAADWCTEAGVFSGGEGILTMCADMIAGDLAAIFASAHCYFAGASMRAVAGVTALGNEGVFAELTPALIAHTGVAVYGVGFFQCLFAGGETLCHLVIEISEGGDPQFGRAMLNDFGEGVHFLICIMPQLQVSHGRPLAFSGFEDRGDYFH